MQSIKKQKICKSISLTSYKTTELDGLSEIPKEKSIPFLLLWDCILNACDKAPPELRSVYASFLVENKYEQVLLNLLFRMMPSEILRNQDSKAAGSVYFVPLSWEKISCKFCSSFLTTSFYFYLKLNCLTSVLFCFTL